MFCNDSHQLNFVNPTRVIIKTASIMKSIVVCAFLLALAVSSYGAEFGDGRPGCKTEEETTVALYRNIWDPTAYWKCEKLGEAASPVRCPDQEAFQDSVKKCVTWDDWAWEEPRAPPSKP